jgi:hypothetical protein
MPSKFKPKGRLFLALKRRRSAKGPTPPRSAMIKTIRVVMLCRIRGLTQLESQECSNGRFKFARQLSAKCSVGMAIFCDDFRAAIDGAKWTANMGGQPLTWSNGTGKDGAPGIAMAAPLVNTVAATADAAGQIRFDLKVLSSPAMGSPFFTFRQKLGCVYRVSYGDNKVSIFRAGDTLPGPSVPLGQWASLVIDINNDRVDLSVDGTGVGKDFALCDGMEAPIYKVEIPFGGVSIALDNVLIK